MGTKFTIFDNGVNPERKNYVPESARIREELGAVCYVSVPETRERMEQVGVEEGRKSQANWSIIPAGDQRLGNPRAPENDCDHSRNRCPEPENQHPATKCEWAKVENLWEKPGGFCLTYVSQGGETRNSKFCVEKKASWW